MTALRDYLVQNIRYPETAATKKIKGRLWISFIVLPDGQLIDPEIVQGLGGGCDEEAIRLVKAMPLWKPGTQSGKALHVKYKIPVFFGLDYSSYPKLKHQ